MKSLTVSETCRKRSSLNRSSFFGASSLGDVPEAPDPAHAPALDLLRLRVPLEDPAVLEFHHVKAHVLGRIVQGLDLCCEMVGIFQLVQNEQQDRFVVPAGQDFRLGMFQSRLN